MVFPESFCKNAILVKKCRHIHLFDSFEEWRKYVLSTDRETLLALHTSVQDIIVKKPKISYPAFELNVLWCWTICRAELVRYLYGPQVYVTLTNSSIKQNIWWSNNACDCWNFSKLNEYFVEVQKEYSAA